MSEHAECNGVASVAETAERVRALNLRLQEQEGLEERRELLDSLEDEDRRLLDSPEVFLDERDLTLYTVLTVGSTQWLCENLRYGGEGTTHPEGSQYGGLYTLAQARKACPEGWNIPGNREWDELFMAAGGYYDGFEGDDKGERFAEAPGILKGWGFGVDLTGYKQPGFQEYGNEAMFWSRSGAETEDDDHLLLLNRKQGYLKGWDRDVFAGAYSCRCVRDLSPQDRVKMLVDAASSLPEGEDRERFVRDHRQEIDACIEAKQAFLDQRDFQLYSVVKMGGLYWLGENARYDTGSEAWIYEDDPGKLYPFGRLYTSDSAGEACPEGCRLPSCEDWNRLVAAAGGDVSVIRESDKNSGALHALTKGSASRFGARLGGIRFQNTGRFSDLNETGYYWADGWGDEDESEGRAYYAFSEFDGLYQYFDESYEPAAMSCRFLLDM